jgi:hypothetical protein
MHNRWKQDWHEKTFIGFGNCGIRVRFMDMQRHKEDSSYQGQGIRKCFQVPVTE